MAAGVDTFEDERQRAIRHRAAHRTLLVLACLAWGIWLAMSIWYDTTITLSGDQIKDIAFLSVAAGWGIYKILSREAWWGRIVEARVRFTTDSRARRSLWVWVVAVTAYLVGMFFLVSYFAAGQSFWSSLLKPLALTVLLAALIVGPLLKRATRNEIEEVEQ